MDAGARAKSRVRPSALESGAIVDAARGPPYSLIDVPMLSDSYSLVRPPLDDGSMQRPFAGVGIAAAKMLR